MWDWGQSESKARGGWEFLFQPQDCILREQSNSTERKRKEIWNVWSFTIINMVSKLQCSK